jgi:hypothetical protein
VPPGDNVDTLRAAVPSRPRTEDHSFGLGRVNVRNRAAMGFNPTDWYKAKRLGLDRRSRSGVLHENRQTSA